MKTASEIRNIYLSFFKEKGHKIIPSAPVVVKDDPTLLFVNAGMNQFKDIFLGKKNTAVTRIANTQKCLRVSGKHNDLEEVGHDSYHHTFFEMLGNWSFGDYYKEEAIEWAWELLNKVFQIPAERLYVTIFGGDAADGLSRDEEAFNCWKKWISTDRILDFDKKDNFWEMGDTGPSGPCSEIHIDLRNEEERNKVPGARLVNEGHPEVIEIWNLVFMQYNRLEDGSLEPLPTTHVDTGMGFERLCRVLQKVGSNYETDLFKPYISFFSEALGLTYGNSTDQDIAMRVVMDHLRAITFTIADGIVPSNTGAGYVIRRILRRAARYAYQFLAQDKPFIHRMIPLVAEIYKDIFPEIQLQQEFIQKIVLEEEKGFLSKLARGTTMLENYLKERDDKKAPISGEFAFTLYDTYGFPIDLTRLMAKEKGFFIEEEGFIAAKKAQQERSRKATGQKTGDWVTINESNELPKFVGYDTLTHSTEILQYRTVENAKGKQYQLSLRETPFYPEGGGQAGDRGILEKGTERIHIVDTQKENELIIHTVNKLPKEGKGIWKATVDRQLRRKTAANHSATHLLHAALRKVLGPHVEQRGSLVNEKLLRFDFSHFAKLSQEEIVAIEALVNQKIEENIAVDEQRAISLKEAKSKGAMALFGEKYGNQVRMITFEPGFSVELCGGTHVKNTSEIRLFKIMSESSVAAGIRRIEACTGNEALAYLNHQEAELAKIKALFKQPQNIIGTIESLQEKARKMEKRLEKLQAAQLKQQQEGLATKAKSINGIQLLNQVVPVNNADELKSLTFQFRNKLQNTVILLGANLEGKALLNLALTKDLEQTNKYNAGQLIREVAKAIQGGGGGQAFFASAGGKKPEGLAEAMQKIEKLL